MGKRTFYRTVITVEVLSEEDVVGGMCLADIAHEIVYGDLSGRYRVTRTESVDGPTMARLLSEQGSDPEFFGLDEDGNNIGAEGDGDGEE